MDDVPHHPHPTCHFVNDGYLGRIDRLGQVIYQVAMLLLKPAVATVVNRDDMFGNQLIGL